MGNPRQLVAVLLVAGLLIGTAAVGVTAQATEQPADDAYVSDDGDVVLVYEAEPGEDDPDNAEFGVDVGENLAYGLLTDSVEGTPDVRGQFSGNATPTTLQASGGLSASSPEAVEALALDVSSVTTEETSEADVSLDTTVTDESGMSGFVNALDTSGDVTMSADRLTATAGLDVRTNVPLGERESLRASLTEADGDYELEVDWSRLVPQRQAEQWRNRTTAEQLLQAQYRGIAESLGGSASVDVEEISVSESETDLRLDQAYSVQLSDIDSGLESMLRSGLADNPQFSDEQVDRLASGIAAVAVRNISVDYTRDARDLTGEVTIDVAGYDELALTYFEIAQATGAGNVGDALDRARSQFEAQQAADLEQRFGWRGNLSHPESGVVRAEFEAQSGATNWGAYVDELRDRDVPFVSQEFALTGDLRDERLAFNGSASMSGEELFDLFTQGFPSGGDTPAESAAIFEGLRNSSPEKAKVIGSYDSDGLRVEAGAEFGELAQLRDTLANQSGSPRFGEVVGRVNESGGETIVRVPGVASSDPTEASVRELTGVSAETTIHLPGEWDRSFPAMDVERARDFLSDAGAGSSGPGFGPVAAVVAILVAAGLLGRRRSD